MHKCALTRMLQVSGDMRTGRIDFPRVYDDVLHRCVMHLQCLV